MTDTYTHYPLHFDPTSKTITLPGTPSPLLTTHLTTLTSLSQSLTTLPFQLPPPPVPVPPQRSAAIEKMRLSANAAFKRGDYDSAISLYTHAISMALTRPPWEAAGLMKDELQVLYSNRAQARLSKRDWPEALADAEMSCELKRGGNGKGWWRRGKALVEMGRWEEARGVLVEGRGVSPGGSEEKELGELLEVVERRLGELGVKKGSEGAWALGDFN